MEFLLFALSVALVDAAALYLMFLRFRKKFREEISAGEVVERARREIGSLIAELNRTTDRSVSLLEDRTAAAKEASDAASKSFEALRREREGKERERAAYERMGRVRPLVREGESGVRPGIDPSQAMKAGARKAEERRETGTAMTQPTAEAGKEGRKPAFEKALPRIEASREPISTEESAAERALRLWERGISADLIAARVGMSVAEVDLVIAMEEQRRLTAR
jgi:hypothetical protein